MGRNNRSSSRSAAAPIEPELFQKKSAHSCAAPDPATRRRHAPAFFHCVPAPR